jgi:hypothetical protein
MLHIIGQLEAVSNQLSLQTLTNLQQAKEKLQHLQEHEVEKLTDKVFSRPAHEQHIDLNSPENLLHSCYNELDRLSREEGTSSQLQEAVLEMRYYFSIEEQDGFFP